MAKPGWEIFCSHANENPYVCKCPAYCGCREGMCKGKTLLYDYDNYISALPQAVEARQNALYMQVGPVIGFYCIVDGCMEFIDETKDPKAYCVKHWNTAGLKLKVGLTADWIHAHIVGIRNEEKLKERVRIEQTTTHTPTNNVIVLSHTDMQDFRRVAEKILKYVK